MSAVRYADWLHIHDALKQGKGDAPLMAVLADDGGGLLIDPCDLAELPDQIAPLEAHRVADCKVFSAWQDLFGLLHNFYRGIQSNSSVANPLVLAVMGCMNHELVGFELDDLGGMHAVIAHVQIMNRLADVKLLADCNHASGLHEQMFHCGLKLQ